MKYLKAKIRIFVFSDFKRAFSTLTLYHSKQQQHETDQKDRVNSMQRSSLSVNVSHSPTLSNRMFIQHKIKREALRWHLGQNQSTKAAPKAKEKSNLFQVFPPNVGRRAAITSYNHQPIYPLPENACKFKLCEMSNYYFHPIKRLHQQQDNKATGLT